MARTSSLLRAGQALALDHSTVGRRLTQLETALSTSLVIRSPRGATLTPAGEKLLIHAERMEADWQDASTALGTEADSSCGPVRLATPEAFGTYLIAPNVGRLLERHPRLELELVPESRSVSLSKREADIAIALTRPVTGRVIAQRLTNYRIGVYASRDYLADASSLDDPAGIASHPLVWFIEELITLPQLRYLDQIAGGGRSIFRSSSVAAQQEAVANGVGLGLLHCFAADRDPRLVRVLPETEVVRSYWLMFHADQQKLPRVRAVVTFIRELVDQNRHLL